MKRILAGITVAALMLTMVGCIAQNESTPTTERSSDVGTTTTVTTVTTVTTETTETEATEAATTTGSSVTETETTEGVITTTSRSRASSTTAVTTKKPSTTTSKKPTVTTKKTTTTTQKTTTTTTKKATTTTTTAAPNDTDVYAIGQYMTTLINRERAAEGLPPVEHRVDLQAYADLRAAEIRELFSHTRPNGKDCFSVFEDRHFLAMGENIAMGQQTVVEVMEDWMNSPGHRANILSADFNGVAIGFDEYHWVQLFVYE